MRSFFWTLIALCLLSLSACSSASFGPRIQGVWNPQVGSGAVYQVRTKKGETMQLQYAIVGKEGTRYWLESDVAETRSKVLLDPATGKAEKMIMQTPGNPPMDMTPAMKFGQALISPRGQQMADTSLKERGTLIGKESITTPAGTFPTTHYRSTDGGNTADVWIAETVRPYGLVKMASSAGDTIELVRVLKNVTSQIATP